MPFPLIFPLAAAVTTSANALGWYLGGVATFGLGAVFFWFRNRRSRVEPIEPEKTTLYGKKEKITTAIETVTALKLRLSALDEQAKEELDKAKIAYQELGALFEKLKSGLSDAKELEETIEKISRLMRVDSIMLDVLQQKMLSPAQKYAFFSSSEFKQQSMLAVMDWDKTVYRTRS